MFENVNTQTHTQTTTRLVYYKLRLTLSTMKLKSVNDIKIFDSAFTSMSFPTQQVVCQLLRDGPPKRGDKILLKFMDRAYQNNSDDCGLDAIANTVAEAYDIDQPHRSRAAKFTRIYGNVSFCCHTRLQNWSTV